MTITQRIEALLEADKFSLEQHYAEKAVINNHYEDSSNHISANTIRDLLRVVAVQADALEFSNAAIPIPTAMDLHKAQQALTESAPLVELAKRMEMV